MPDLAQSQLTPLDLWAFRRKGTTQNRWYIPNQCNDTALNSGFVFVANHLYAIPFIVSDYTTINDMGISVTSSVASSQIRMGIYNDNGNCYPNALLVDAGTIASTTVAFLTVALGSTLKLRPGLYWCTAVSGHAPNTRGVNAAGAISILAMDNVAASTTPGLGWDGAHTMGALPATYPASASIKFTVIPAICVRLVAN